MKQLIVPVTIILTLIALFIIVDRKDFSRHDDVQTIQNESATPNRKSSITVPQTKPITEVILAVETKPTETMPVAGVKQMVDSKPVTEAKPKTDAKPARTKPVVETKLVETKLAEVKPVAKTKPVEITPIAEKKPVAETKPEEKPAPTAVPIATAEEAEKLNEEAIIYFNNLIKSFSATDMNVLEGRISSISSCPAPTTIDYPDCNLTILVVLNDENHTKVVLIIPCIRETKKILSPSIKDNAILRFRIKDEMEISDDERSIQISDDISDFDLEYFYVDYTMSILSFSGKTKFIRKENTKKTFDTQLILTEKDIQKKDKYLKDELSRLNNLIDNYSKEDARVFKENLLEFSKGIGENNFPFVEIGSEKESPKKVFPLKANITTSQYLSSACSFNTDRMFANATVIASIRDFFEKKGIHLIVIPVPQSVEAFINRFNLSNQLSSYNIDRVLLMKYLIEMNVEVFDIEPYIEKNISEPFYYHNHPRNNIHFTSAGDFYFAQHIFDHIRQYDYSELLYRDCRDEFIGEVKWSDYKVTYNNQTFKEMKNADIVSNNNAICNHSPILLIGDSFTMGTLRNSLAYVFRTPISVISAAASSSIMTRILQMREKEIPQETKVCFYVFYTSFLTGYFAPFISKDSIQIYPSESNSFVFPNFDIEGKDLQEDLSIDFSIDLSSYSSDAQTYTLFFYLSSTSQQKFIVSVNSTFKGQEESRGSGHGVVAVRLTKEALQQPLSINVKTIPYINGAPLNQNKNLLLKIDKILFSHD